MDMKYMAENGIDTENVIQTGFNDCLVTVYFAKNKFNGGYLDVSFQYYDVCRNRLVLGLDNCERN